MEVVLEIAEFVTNVVVHFRKRLEGLLLPLSLDPAELRNDGGQFFVGSSVRASHVAHSPLELFVETIDGLRECFEEARLVAQNQVLL